MFLGGYHQGVPVLGEGLYSKKIRTPTSYTPYTPPIPPTPLYPGTGDTAYRGGGIPVGGYREREHLVSYPLYPYSYRPLVVN